MTTTDAGSEAGRARFYGAAIPLLEDFRFTHEPIGTSGASRFVGRQAELQRLAERILFSDGGSFLIAGYRGVGKTSFVNRVVQRVRELAAAQQQLVGKMDIVDVHLMLARPMEAVELMHHVVRRLRERLRELELFDRLPPALQHDIERAHQRTSMSLSLKRGAKIGSEGALGELGVSAGGVGVKLSRKKTTELTSAAEWSYLAYDDRAAESDVMRIAERVAEGYEAPLPWPQRMLRTLRGAGSPKVPLKIIFVFDELDKIDEEASRSADGQPFLDRLLGHLKNLFTTSHISFIFVAGKDLYDRWLLDVGRGDSVYESVFCYDRYIPCMWADVENVCRSVIPIYRLDGEQRASCDEFIAFLKFKGRGIPRKLLREFHYYVQLRGDRLQLSFNRDDRRRFRFYSELQNAIDEAAAEMFGATTSDASAIEYDKKRLAAYYLIDWVLAHGATEFGEEQAVARSRELSAKIAPAEELAAPAVSSIMRMLVKYEFLEEVNRQSGDKTILSEIEGRVGTRYRLTSRRRAELDHFAALFEDEKSPGVPAVPTPDSRFRAIEQLGEGGMSSTYRAWDETLQRVIAVKVLAPEMAGERSAQQRFRREGRILEALDHPNIVRCHGTSQLGGNPALVLEFIDGVSLDRLLVLHGRFSVPFVAAIAAALARALEHVHSRRVSRIDLKPSNIMVRRDGQPVLTDMGIAHYADTEVTDRLTKPGFLLGTPHYMAPEQIEDPDKPDPRSDIYSLGVVLFEMLTGQLPFAAQSLRQLITMILREPAPRVSDSVEVPARLSKLIAACLSKKPAERPTTTSILESLAALDLEPFDAAAFVEQSLVRNAEAEQARDHITAEVALPEPVAEVAPPPPAPEAESQPQTGASLEIREPEHLAGMSKAVGERFRIGRGEANDWAIADVSLSRHHAEIICRDGDYFLRDLFSSNGTAVHGTFLRPAEEHPLSDRAVIRAGNVTFVFKR
jgi:hypothetical protein